MTPRKGGHGEEPRKVKVKIFFTFYIIFTERNSSIIWTATGNQNDIIWAVNIQLIERIYREEFDRRNCSN